MPVSWKHPIALLFIAWVSIGTRHEGRVFAAPPASRAVEEAERKALEFLGREVPQWSKEHDCFSCHNNGDAARALLAATRKKVAIPPGALETTVAFLARPERWDRNGVDAAFSDKKLARLQFAHALSAAVEAGAVNDRSVLLRAADRVAADQADDGSWKVDDLALIGSPATYGPPLATAVARRILTMADPDRYSRPIGQAGRWLRARPVHNVLDAAAVLLGLDRADMDPRGRAFALLKKAQLDEGGWGPFVEAPPETFDTALALLALSRWTDRAEARPMIERGRRYLVSTQSEDGGWPGTTRPSGGESYAQRLSTTGWATLALLATDP